MRTYVEVGRETHDGEEPEDLVEPAGIAAEPVRVLMGQRGEQEIEEVDGRQRDGAEEQRLEHARAYLVIAARNERDKVVGV